MMLLIWIAIGFLIYYLVSSEKLPKTNNENKKTPEIILKERYVNGEIDDETYLRMRQTINK